MNCCHCFLWCRGSLQGLKAGMRWRHPNPLDLIDFLFLIASLALLLVFSFFFLRFLRGTNADESEEEVQKMPKLQWVPFFPLLFFGLWKNPPFFFFGFQALKAQRKKARKLVKVFVISSGGSIHKSHRDFFFYGEKNWGERDGARAKTGSCAQEPCFFFGKETLTTAFVPSFYLNLAWRNWYFVVNL